LLKPRQSFRITLYIAIYKATCFDSLFVCHTSQICRVPFVLETSQTSFKKSVKIMGKSDCSLERVFPENGSAEGRLRVPRDQKCVMATFDTDRSATD